MSINVKPSYHHEDYPQYAGEYVTDTTADWTVMAAWVMLIALCATFWGAVAWVVGLW